MSETERRQSVCKQARAWLGKNEADGSHREILDLYNRHRPPGSYEMQYSDPWCAAFVSAVGMACGLDDVLLPHVNCDGMIAAYKAQGQWVEDDGYTPKPGDLVFYDWQDSGVGDNTGSSDHVGIVAEVSEHYMAIVEGNKSDAVGTRTLAINSRFIRGFAVPDYARRADNEKARSDHGNSSAAVTVDKPEGAASAAEMMQSASPTGSAMGSAVTLPTLRQSCTGKVVRAAQLLLIGHGYSCGKWGADGEFGYNTWNAARRFQLANGLATDGVIGPLTWAVLLGLN